MEAGRFERAGRLKSRLKAAATKSGLRRTRRTTGWAATAMIDGVLARAGELRGPAEPSAATSVARLPTMACYTARSRFCAGLAEGGGDGLAGGASITVG